MNVSSPPFDVAAHLSALRRYAQALTRDAGHAEELVQDALVRAYGRRHTFRPDGDLRAWLFAVLHNTFISGHRRRRAQMARDSATAQVAADHVAPPQDHAVELRQVRAAFAGLPVEQRGVLHLVAVEGFSYQEVAAALEIPVGTVMSRLSRARTGLRALMDERAQASAAAPRLRIVGGSDDT